MKKPNSAQIALLVAGIGGTIAAYFMLKSKNATVPTASGATTNFTGGYPLYESFMSADGGNKEDMCNKLMEALHYVQVALSHTDTLTPAQVTSFRNQEMQILAQLQKIGCHNHGNNTNALNSK